MRRTDGWAVDMNGRVLTFATLQLALENVDIAARTERLLGRKTNVLVEEEDGTLVRLAHTR